MNARTRSRGHLHAARLLFFVGLLSACASTASLEEAEMARAAPISASEGVYTTAQADRGEAIFNRVCSVCHGNREFTGPMFEMTWMAEPVSGLFQHISAAMPQNAPGSLAPAEYASLVAYVMRLNGRPAGDAELPADAEALGGLRW